MGRHHFGRVARACAATALAVATLVGIGGAPAGAVGGSIDGSVSYGGGTLPAGTVQVLACSGTSWATGCGGPTAPVAADGTYSLAVADGDWTVRVRTLQGIALGSPATVNVASASATQNLVVQAAVVNGRVQHPSDRSAYPVGHAVLVLCPTNGGATTTSQALFCTFFGGIATPTDAAGDATVVVPPGQWYSIGAVTGATYVPGSTAPNLPAAVTNLGVLADGGTAPAIADVAGALVSGTVSNAGTSAPLVGTTVSVCPTVGACFPAPASPVQTGSAGEYLFALPPGAFTLSVTGQGGVTASLPVTVVDAVDQTGVDFSIGGGSISGSLQQADGSPYLAVNLPVSLCNGSGACLLVPLNNPYPGSSTFTIANVPAGTYDIIAGSPNTSVMAHLVNAPVGVVDGVDSGGVIVRLGGGSIAVTVTNNGVPVQSASVRACLQAPLGPSGEFCSGSPFGGTDAAGQVTMVGLPPGTYTVRASAPGMWGTSDVVLTDGGSPQLVQIALGPTGAINGSVTGNVGAGAMVVACPGVTDPPASWNNFPSAPCVGGQFANIVNGAYSYPSMIPGDYRLRAYASVNGAIVVSNAAPGTVNGGVTTVVNLALPGGNSGSVPTGGGTVSLAAPAGTSLQNITATAVPTSPAPPPGLDFPVGLVGFSVTGIAPGAAVDVTMTFPAGTNPTGYAKLHDGVWEDFTSHVTIVGDTVTLHLVDGGAGDDDGLANGVVVDPGAPFRGYSFTGFRAPVDNTRVNAAKAGQAIPVKWTIVSAAGVPVDDPASVVSVRSSGAACTGGTADGIEAYTSGASGLQSLGNGNWQFNWKTDKTWAGQCRTLTVKLADGTTHVAQFQFK